MATQRSGKEPGGAPHPGPPVSGEASGDAQKLEPSMGEAYARFASAMVEARLEAEGRTKDALKRYTDAIGAAVDEARNGGEEIAREASKRGGEIAQRQADARQEFVKALEPTSEDKRAVTTAQKALADAVQAAQAEALQRADEAVKQHSAAQLRAPEQASQALATYVDALQKSAQDSTALADAYRAYSAKLDEIAKDTQKQSETAWRAYQTAQFDAQQRTAAAVRTYVEAAQKAAPAPSRLSDATRKLSSAETDASADVAKLEEEHTRRCRETRDRTERSAGDARRAYSEALDQIRSTAQKRQVDAYRAYLVAMQRAWSQLNVDAVLAGLTR